jgi:hypothetical protein
MFAGLIGAAVARQKELEIPVGEAALRRSETDDDDL